MVDFNLNGFKSTYRDYTRSYLFYAKIGNTNYFDKDNSYLVKSTTLPATTLDQMEADWQGHKYKIAATPTYDDFTLTFKIDEKSAIRTQMLTWSVYIDNPVDNMHGDPKTGLYFSDITLNQLNSHGKITQTFTLHDAWPKTVGEVTLDYATKEIATFDVVFSYQYHTIDGIN